MSGLRAFSQRKRFGSRLLMLLMLKVAMRIGASVAVFPPAIHVFLVHITK